jgi:hypothetical protein
MTELMLPDASGAIIPVPIPEQDRDPTPQECNTSGECWWYCREGLWCLDTWQGNYTHWLPFNSLPAPTVKKDLSND